MRLVKYLITGVMLIAGLGLGSDVHARGKPIQSQDDRCVQTIYDKQFKCESREALSFCEQQGSGLYKSAYCDVADEGEDEVLEMMAARLRLPNVEAAKERLYGKATTDEELELQFEAAQEFEKAQVRFQTKQGMKLRFKAAEKWANGDLGDGPFDLIVDLNLIDVVLFGSEATWTSDVYRFPDDEDQGNRGSRGNNDDTGNRGNRGNNGDRGGTEGEPGGGGDSGDGGDDGDYECVPDDDPRNDPPEGCGNGVIDGGEECDDGNLENGDGCSRICLLEDGPSLTCRDGEALTLQDHEGNRGSRGDRGNNDDAGGDDDQCPEGSTRRRRSGVGSANRSSSFAEVPQSSNYGGPFVGGVPKNFPQSRRPICPAGQTDYSLSSSITGGSTSLTEAIGLPECIPTQFCEIFEIGEVGEGSFCIQLKGENWPEAPYNPREGCVDCHIAGINRGLAKVIETGITPKVNTMNAFETSSRWSPTFSLNVIPWVKSKFNTSTKVAERSFDLQDKEKLKNDRGRDAAQSQQLGELEATTQRILEADQARIEKTMGYAFEGRASRSTTFWKANAPALKHLEQRFDGILSTLRHTVLSLSFKQKNQCKL